MNANADGLENVETDADDFHYYHSFMIGFSNLQKNL